MGNLISKLNFYKLISYLVDKGFPAFLSSKGDILISQQKEEVRMRLVGRLGAERTPGEWMRHYRVQLCAGLMQLSTR